MTEVLFDRTGNEVVPTRLTAGPWSPDAQHGGAPAALLAGEIERMLASSGKTLVRLGVDIYRPVPLEPMTLASELLRDGRKVAFVEATLSQGASTLVRASGVGVRLAEYEVPYGSPEPRTYPSPAEATPVNFFERPGAFATDAMEVRMVNGDFDQAGPGAGWFRLRASVTGANDPTPIETACAAADFGNGVSNWAPDFSWMFINPELSVHFARPPEGEWILLDSVTHAHSSGTGLGQSLLVDRAGVFGKSAQSLLVEPFGGRF